MHFLFNLLGERLNYKQHCLLSNFVTATVLQDRNTGSTLQKKPSVLIYFLLLFLTIKYLFWLVNSWRWHGKQSRNQSRSMAVKYLTTASSFLICCNTTTQKYLRTISNFVLEKWIDIMPAQHSSSAQKVWGHVWKHFRVFFLFHPHCVVTKMRCWNYNIYQEKRNWNWNSNWNFKSLIISCLVIHELR